MKRTSAGQQSKKSRSEEVSAPNQQKKQIDNRSKEGVICYQCNKKGHYKLQCSELAKEQFKNANQTPVREMCVKGKDQCPQKSHRHKAKDSSWCDTESKHNVFSISAEGVKLKEY